MENTLNYINASLQNFSPIVEIEDETEKKLNVDYSYLHINTEDLLKTHTLDEIYLKLPKYTATADNYHVKEAFCFEAFDEAVLEKTIKELQGICSLPLQIDTSDAFAMEAALRRYNGKAMINSVNGKLESMSAVFPLVKKYGGLVVALTLDENGIPDTADGRVAIAKKIMTCVRQNVVFIMSTKVVVLVLGAFGYAPIWLAVFADVGVCLMTVVWSLRLLRIKL